MRLKACIFVEITTKGSVKDFQKISHYVRRPPREAFDSVGNLEAKFSCFGPFSNNLTKIRKISLTERILIKLRF
jgi:hypothetical protein